MNWYMFRQWVNDPTRTMEELKIAYAHLPLGPPSKRETKDQYRLALVNYSNQFDALEEIPDDLYEAIGQPAGTGTFRHLDREPVSSTHRVHESARAEPPAARSTVVKPSETSAERETVMHEETSYGWNGLLGLLAVGAIAILAFFLFFGEDVGALNDDLIGDNDNGNATAQTLDSDGDGISDEEERRNGTNEYDSSDPGKNTDDDPTATPAVKDTATPVPAASAAPAAVDSGSMPAFVSNADHGKWTVKCTDRCADNPIVTGWLSRLPDPAPAQWKTFPNIPNADVPGFKVVNGTEVPQGMEYGTYSSPYCFAHPCDIPVGAWEYRYISGDYQFMGTECHGDKTKGCMLVIINVMDQSVTFRNQDVDNGFTLRGRYFDGDNLEWGAWGLISHGSANMLNMPTFAHPGEVLNAGAPGNSGANCGNPQGCGSVDVQLVVVAGDAVIADAHTVVNR